jgi:hypothetical protein
MYFDYTYNNEKAEILLKCNQGYLIYIY